MDSKNKYYVIHNPVERTAPPEKKLTLVSVLNDELSVIHDKLFNKGNFEFTRGRLKIINTSLASYCTIEEVNKKRFDSIYKLLN